MTHFSAILALSEAKGMPTDTVVAVEKYSMFNGV